ncbi:hypothetical protein R1flu_016672 [Riccia fluitans]|uniref:AB hydrolase-1 domain-containing protein n=1 Tax=Riccia fluitans TaxID=41844 RepID=A0ABD1YN11_9MARC
MEEWLKFIVSNSQITGSPPRVLAVITNRDRSETILKLRRSNYPRLDLGHFKGELVLLQERFAGRAELFLDLHHLNAQSKREVKPLTEYIFQLMGSFFSKIPRVPKVCSELSSALIRISRSRNPSPVWTESTFLEFCKDSQTALRDVSHEVLQAVVSYLHDVGSIIKVARDRIKGVKDNTGDESKDKEPWIVVDPNWLTQNFLGELICQGHHFRVQDGSIGGNWSNNEVSGGLAQAANFLRLLEEVLRSKHNSWRKIEVSLLEDIMQDLDLCYRVTVEDGSGRYFVPIVYGGLGERVLFKVLDTLSAQVDQEAWHEQELQKLLPGHHDDKGQREIQAFCASQHGCPGIELEVDGEGSQETSSSSSYSNPSPSEAELTKGEKFLAASESQKIHLPQGVSKICDEVYEIYAPAAGSGVAKLEVVFIHGLQSDVSDETSFLSAWSVRGVPSNCWLKSWLPNRFPESRIICVSYDASPVKTSSQGTLDMFLTAENLISSLVNLGEIGQSCPVILVGHSLGGLVATNICNRVHKVASYSGADQIPYTKFRDNIKGLFFYSTPFKGLSSFWGSKEKESGDLMSNLGLLDTATARSNEDFAKLRATYGWETRGVLESSETTLYVEGVASTSKNSNRFVCEASARVPFVETMITLRDADHFTICRPETEQSSNFLYLVKFLESILRKF